MSTTFMSRAKVALIAVATTVAMAIGMTAVSPASAQAITTSNGAKIVDLSFQGSTTFKGHDYSLAYDWSQAAPGDSHVGSWNVYLMIDDEVQDNPMSILVFDTDIKAIELNQILQFKFQAIILKNGTTFFYRSDAGCYFNAFVVKDPKNRQVFFPGTDVATNEGLTGDVYKVDGNDLLVRYLRVGDTTFKSTNNGRNVTYTYRYKYNASSNNLFKRSSSICTPLSTTKWRTLASKKTAYKSSTSKTKKFSIKAGSKVQVKKIYTTSTKCRYYVKTKSGKYGWITGKKLDEDEA